MQENKYRDELEQFLQEEANQHRLYPSDRVWQNINKNLHGHKRWPALSIAGLFLLVSVVAVSVYFQPNPSLFVINPLIQQASAPVTAVVPKASNRLTFNPHKNADDNFIDELNTAAPIAKVQLASIATVNNTSNTNVLTVPTVAFIEKMDRPSTTLLAAIPTTTAFKFNSSKGNSVLVPEATINQHNNNSVLTTSNATDNNIADAAITQKPKRTDETGEKNAVDKFLNEQQDLAEILKQAKPLANQKWNFHFYITPSQSYRSLQEDQNFEKAHAATLNAALTFNTPGNLHNAAKHKPALGMEVGAGVSYNINDKIRLKTGLQFNLRQYKIDAYLSSTEMTIIGLTTSSALNTFSMYRTNNGSKPIELLNKYYQLSIPLGFEWDAVSKNKLKWTVAAAVQPSFQLNRNALLMSTDYKNYTESPSLLRTWNINSSLETFVSYKIGDYRWQIGPQIRYQHLPTFNKKYPIRENLLDYGVKIGFTKVIQ